MYTQIIENKRQYTGMPILTVAQFNTLFVEIFKNELKFESSYSDGLFKKDGCTVFVSFSYSQTAIGFTENIRIIVEENLRTTIAVDPVKKNFSLDGGRIFNIIFEILRFIWKDKFTAKEETIKFIEEYK